MAWRPSYVTGAELQAYARNTVAGDAATYVARAEVASRAVDGTCHRQFGFTESAETRAYAPRYARSIGRYVLSIDDIQGSDIGDLTVVAPDGGPVFGCTLLPLEAPNDGMPYTRLALPDGTGRPDVLGMYTVTAPRWGWDAVPAQVIDATYLQGARIAWRRQSPAGIAGSPDSGSEIRLLSKVDPDVAVVLRGLVRRPDLA